MNTIKRFTQYSILCMLLVGPCAFANSTETTAYTFLHNDDENASLTLKKNEGMASLYEYASGSAVTSSGEQFDPNQRTAAHPTLPFDTHVRVVNLDNGRATVVRINDRGIGGDQLISVSQGAADALDMGESGMAQVRLEVIDMDRFVEDASEAEIDTVVNKMSTGEVGVASWYGDPYHGRATANGETYNMEAATAAHRTLPFNTTVRVVNLENGRSTTVRINDRGPYVEGRIIDLSHKAAKELDMIDQGTAPVELFIEGAGTEPQRNWDEESFAVQIGSFKDEQTARSTAAQLRGSWIATALVNGTTYYRVFFGRYGRADEAAQAQAQLRTYGITGFVKQIQN